MINTTQSIFYTTIQLIKFLPRDLKYVVTKKLILQLIICFAFIFYTGSVIDRVVGSGNLYTPVFMLIHSIIFSNISLLLFLVTSRNFLINLLQSHNFINSSSSFPLKSFSVLLCLLCFLDAFTKYYGFRINIVFFCVFVFASNIVYTSFTFSQQNKLNLDIFKKGALTAALFYIIYGFLSSLAQLLCAYMVIKRYCDIQLLVNTDAIIEILGAIVLGVLNGRSLFIHIKNSFFEFEQKEDARKKKLCFLF